MAKVTILCGIPCSGKTTYCKKFPEFDVISRDAIRIVFFEKDYQYTDVNENRVTTIFKKLFEESVKEKKDIILDNTHCKEKYLNDAIKLVPDNYEMEVVFLNTPLWKAYIRNVWRYMWTKKWVPFGIIAQMKKNFDKIDKKKYEMVQQRLSFRTL